VAAVSSGDQGSRSTSQRTRRAGPPETVSFTSWIVSDAFALTAPLARRRSTPPSVAAVKQVEQPARGS
jgi:hypothetical protein